MRKGGKEPKLRAENNFEACLDACDLFSSQDKTTFPR